ncbi:MAG: hypothetical protein FJ405_10950 [Verrucomicrobia bacterium]|nr:hypothetical protein [Verrucomicrobiota bacterium]
MNSREKILAAAVGGLLVLFAGGFLVRSFIMKPLKDIDRKTAVLRDKLSKAQGERRAYFETEDRMKQLALRTFADNIDQASAKSGEVVTRTILSGGLVDTEFTRLPFGPRKLPGANEIGWTIQGEGPLSNVVNLVHVLDQSSWLHRIDGLSLTPSDLPGLVKVRFRYLTLVLDPAPEVVRKDPPSPPSLDTPQRRMLDGLVERDLLRPYIKRPAPPPPPALASQGQAGPAASARPPGPESFRVVSLSEWLGEPEVHVRDLVNQKTMRYKPGDAFAGGTILTVDYRPLPIPGTGGSISSSRVLVKIGEEIWAVDRGRTLADKRKLVAAELPPSTPARQ